MTYLSVIIPAYNEAARLPSTIERVSAYLSVQSYQSELIIVENGSTDDTTRVAWKYLMECTMPLDNVRGRIIHSAQGKGAAVQAGMLAGAGTWLFMCDADLSMPIEELDKLLPPYTEAQIVIASREAWGARRINEPEYRHLTGRAFNAVIWLLLPHIQDSQCGFKLFERSVARDLFSCLTVTGWAFDVEMLYLARRAGYIIEEVGVEWWYSSDSRIRLIRDSIAMARDVLKIWLRGQLEGHEAIVDRVSTNI